MKDFLNPRRASPQAAQRRSEALAAGGCANDDTGGGAGADGLEVEVGQRGGGERVEYGAHRRLGERDAHRVRVRTATRVGLPAPITVRFGTFLVGSTPNTTPSPVAVNIKLGGVQASAVA